MNSMVIEWSNSIAIALLSIFCTQLSSQNATNNITFIIFENYSIGQLVGEMPTATNNSDLTYLLQDTTYFDFDKKNPSRLLVQRLLDRDTDRRLCSESGWPQICAWSGVVFASNGQLMSLRILIQDVNDNKPSWYTKPSHPSQSTALLEVHVSENCPLGSRLDLPPALDRDLGRNSIVSYKLIDSTSSQQLPFEIENLGGPNGVICQLIVKGSLDRESTPYYKLTLCAIDGDGNEGFAELIVHVSDENDNAPVFQHPPLPRDQLSFLINVDEDLPVGTRLPNHPKAIDVDDGAFGQITYRFSLSTSELVKRDFRLNRTSGELFVRAPLDYDTGGLTQYAFTIIAEDGGSPSLSATTSVVINVQDKNDNQPTITVTPAPKPDKFLKYSTTSVTDQDRLYLVENVSQDTLIATITVEDSDSNENGKFTCKLDRSNEVKLVYLKPMGQLSIYQLLSVRSIDREAQPQLRTLLRCTDHGQSSQTSTELLTVHVVDLNDNEPIFRQDGYMFEVLEGDELGRLIGRIDASDKDDGLNAKLTYSVIWPTNKYGPSLFRVNSSGELTNTGPLDREANPKGYQFLVSVHDNGYPRKSNSTQVNVSLLDINDCRPVFDTPLYEFSLEEEVEIQDNRPLTVGNVKVSDCDAGVNAQLSLSINPPSELFQITQDGRITTSQTLDRERQSFHKLTIQAVDSPFDPSQRLTSTVQVSIGLVDMNDNSPRFVRPPFASSSSASGSQANDSPDNELEVSLYETSGQQVGQVEAIDDDFGANGRVVYQLAPGRFSDWFHVDQQSGQLILQRDLSTENEQRIPLTIIAVDQSTTSQRNTASVSIVIHLTPTPPTQPSHQSTQTSGKSRLWAGVTSNKFVIICIVLVTFLVCSILGAIILALTRPRWSRSGQAGSGLVISSTNGGGDKRRPHNPLLPFGLDACNQAWPMIGNEKAGTNGHVDSIGHHFELQTGTGNKDEDGSNHPNQWSTSLGYSNDGDYFYPSTDSNGLLPIDTACSEFGHIGLMNGMTFDGRNSISKQRQYLKSPISSHMSTLPNHTDFILYNTNHIDHRLDTSLPSREVKQTYHLDESLSRYSRGDPSSTKNNQSVSSNHNQQLRSLLAQSDQPVVSSSPITIIVPPATEPTYLIHHHSPRFDAKDHFSSSNGCNFTSQLNSCHQLGDIGLESAWSTTFR